MCVVMGRGCMGSAWVGGTLLLQGRAKARPLTARFVHTVHSNALVHTAQVEQLYRSQSALLDELNKLMQGKRVSDASDTLTVFNYDHEPAAALLQGRRLLPHSAAATHAHTGLHTVLQLPGLQLGLGSTAALSRIQNLVSSTGQRLATISQRLNSVQVRWLNRASWTGCRCRRTE